jgi:hypothetical protein
MHPSHLTATTERTRRASRMESTGVPGSIHVSEATQALLQGEDWEPTGGIEVRG